MKMIIGGAYQGKTEYALKKYNISENEIADGENINKVSEYRCIKNFHLFIKQMLTENKDPLEETRKVLLENPDIIIIMNEIGNGIIPIEKSERIWREQVGKVGCFLAEQAESVERIICGISVKIK